MLASMSAVSTGDDEGWGWMENTNGVFKSDVSATPLSSDPEADAPHSHDPRPPRMRTDLMKHIPRVLDAALAGVMSS